MKMLTRLCSIREKKIGHLKRWVIIHIGYYAVGENEIGVPKMRNNSIFPILDTF